MSNYTLNITPQLYDYIKKVGYREPDVLRELREQTLKMSMAQMQICPEQGQLMQMLIAVLGAKKTLEVGVFTGYSTLCVGLALPDDGKVIACDINSDWTGIAKKYWDKARVQHKIDLRLAPALETLQKLVDNNEENTFDFAFIDADKLNYPAYYEFALKLLRPGGLIAVDNVLWDGDVADSNVTDANTNMFRELNKKIHADARVAMCMIPIGDGLTLVRKL